jgi:hypothetical protein
MLENETKSLQATIERLERAEIAYVEQIHRLQSELAARFLPFSEHPIKHKM